MKKRKIKLFASIASLALVVAVMGVGVWAATTQSVTMTAKASFTATALDVSIDVKATGNAQFKYNTGLLSASTGDSSKSGLTLASTFGRTAKTEGTTTTYSWDYATIPTASSQDLATIAKAYADNATTLGDISLTFEETDTATAEGMLRAIKTVSTLPTHTTTQGIVANQVFFLTQDVDLDDQTEGVDHPKGFYKVTNYATGDAADTYESVATATALSDLDTIKLEFTISTTGSVDFTIDIANALSIYASPVATGNDLTVAMYAEVTYGTDASAVSSSKAGKLTVTYFLTGTHDGNGFTGTTANAPSVVFTLSKYVAQDGGQ